MREPGHGCLVPQNPVPSTSKRPPGRRYADPVPYTRITVDPGQMGGAPCLRGLRITVATVVAMVADGMSTQEILTDLPDLEAEDISEALRFAADAVRERQLPLQQTA